MATIRFNQPEEFLEELARDQELVHRRIVRVTCRYTVGRASPNIHHLQVVATALVDGQVVMLERYIGDVWRIPDQDRPVLSERDRVMRELTERLEGQGFDVRTGVVEADHAPA